MKHKTQKILIIGALGGLGLETLKELTNKGNFVFAADVSSDIIEKYKDNDLVFPLVLDVTDSISIENAFKLISSQTSDLDAIVHMAGLLEVGSVVEVEIEDLRRVLEINFFGVYRINKKFFPMLVSTKGKIIILSSETAKQTTAPFNGIYSISKYALEAYSDALRRELAFLQIRVIKIHPGAFRTSMTKRVEDLFELAEHRSFWFKKNISKGRSYLPNIYKNAKSPKLLARRIVHICNNENPKTAYSLYPDLKRTLLEYLPVKWADRLIKKFLT